MISWLKSLFQKDPLARDWKVNGFCIYISESREWKTGVSRYYLQPSMAEIGDMLKDGPDDEKLMDRLTDHYQRRESDARRDGQHRQPVPLSAMQAAAGHIIV